MNNLKFELIIAYYKRLKIVLNALESIKNSGYENWHLTFINNSGDNSFRREAFTSKNVWYPYPWTAALDAYLFDGMYKEWGPCHFINDFGQCKAVFFNNLSKRLRNNSMFYNE